MGLEIAEKPKLRTSYDNMEAFLQLPVPQDEQGYTAEGLEEYLNALGIKAGIDREMLRKMVDDKIYMVERRIAVGKRPVEGHDGNYEFFFSRSFNRAPKILPDGSADYHDVNVIATVGKDEKIAEYHPCQQGENGFNVKGAPIAAKRCRELPPLKGKGFSRSEDGNSYYSNLDGKIDYQMDRINISPLYEIPGDVDLSVGNIDFTGDVIIHGTVKAGMMIKATGSITIDGIVESASMEAGRDIVLKSGLMGNSQAVIKTKGNLFAKFIEYASLDIRGTINAEVLFNCDVVCGEKIVIVGQRGSIVGGTLRAISGIEANSIGNEMEVKTSLAVGAEVDVYRRLKVLEHKIESVQKNMEAIDKKVQEIEREMAPKTVMEKPKPDPRKVSMLRMKIRENTTLQEARLELEELTSIVSRADGAMVSVYGKVCPGTVIRIDDVLLNVREEQFAVQFIKHVDKIHMERIVDSVF